MPTGETSTRHFWGPDDHSIREYQLPVLSGQKVLILPLFPAGESSTLHPRGPDDHGVRDLQLPVLADRQEVLISTSIPCR